MTTPILRAHAWPTNAALIADVARLGYFHVKRRGAPPREAEVVDCTYGRGLFWTIYRPVSLVAHDLNPAKGDGVNYHALPEADGTYDVAVLDAPYVGAGGFETSSVKDFREGYGIEEKSRRPEAVTADICGGLAECARVVVDGGYVLVKAMNYVEGGQYRTVAYDILAHARTALGLVLADEFVHVSGTGPQPGCRTCEGKGTIDVDVLGDPGDVICPKCGGTGDGVQQHTRANYSLLFVLRKPRTGP